MNLSENFTLEELTASETAARAGIDNTPPEYATTNLRRLARFLESVRVTLGHRAIRINSGYRCQALNSRLGSNTTSAHTAGLAADLTCTAFGSPLEVCRAIANSGIAFDQIIHEFKSWCHFAIAHEGLIVRKELLTIDENGTRKGLET